MIELIGKPGELNCRIKFSPRPGFRETHKVVDRKLVYGHYCPRCSNVVQALFLTDTPVDLWPYEETNVISLSQDEYKYGTTLRITPNAESAVGDTDYTSTIFRGCVRGQHLALKNHVLKYHGIELGKDATDRFLEVGDRTCEYTGVFTRRGDLAVRDLCHFFRLEAESLADRVLPSVDEFMALGTNTDFRVLPAYGEAPPMLLFPRSHVQGRWADAWQLHQILNAFDAQRAGA